MNATSSGVASSAAKMRSPSFSRSSSSTTTTALPDLMSAMARSIESSRTVIDLPSLRSVRSPEGSACLIDSLRRRRSSRLHQSRDVLRQDVDLEIHRIARRLVAEGGRAQRFGDQPYLEPVGTDAG